MTIQILGGGCANCKTLEKRARETALEMGLEAVFEKVTDYQDIMKMGVTSTPALAIDGEVKSFGKVLTKAEIKGILEN